MSSEGIFETTSSRPKAERSVTALLADLVNEIGLLMRHEMALLRTELGETVRSAAVWCCVPPPVSALPRSCRRGFRP
jgi:hypothetical protein